ncbi:MAG TPA: ABC transporter ATP-binding protein [Thermoanaerobaculia bacterium]
MAAAVNVEAKAFKSNRDPVVVLRNLKFDIAAGEFLAILGPSGCGKTTLLRLISGLDTDYEGTIRINSHTVRGPSRSVGIMFQEDRLLPWMRVGKNVEFAVDSTLPRSEKTRIAEQALALVGLSETTRLWPKQLSGGMAKRVALARAVVNLPGLLLLDEPLTALDTPTKYALQDEIARIHRESASMSTVLVTHDVSEAVYLSDRLLILTPRDAHIDYETPIPLPRPRDRTSADFQDLVAEVTGLMLEKWRNGSRNSERVEQ